MSKTDSDPSKPRHPIQVAANRSGLSAHAIRAWERRYTAILPQRSGSRRRLYSDADIERLRLLRQAAAAGRRISDLARLSDSQLYELVDDDKTAVEDGDSPHLVTVTGRGAKDHFTRCMAAVREMDGQALEAALVGASAALSLPAFLEDVLTPLMRRIGQEWKHGRLRISHEHAATAVVRSFLGNMAGAASAAATGPKVLVTTPTGQVHELGALMVTAIAAYAGWKAVYLGPSMPAEEIAYATLCERAQALALSISYPADDPLLPGELRKLRRCLDSRVRLIVGGAAARGSDELLRDIEAIRCDSLQTLTAKLDELRSGPY